MDRSKTLNADAVEQKGLTGEEYLWVSVLSRAAEDAFMISCNTLSAVRDVEQALHWFVRGGQDFNLTCEYAGRNPAYVHHKAVIEYTSEIKKRKKYFKSREREIRKELEYKIIKKYNKKHKTYFTSIKTLKEHMLMKRKAKNNRSRKRIRINGKKYEANELRNL